MASEDCVKGFLIGGLIGAVLGILYAPRSGRETREEICNSADELLTKAKGQYGSACARIEQLVEREKALCADTRERLMKAVDAGVAALREEKEA